MMLPSMLCWDDLAVGGRVHGLGIGWPSRSPPPSSPSSAARKILCLEERFVVEWQADDEVPFAAFMKEDLRGVSWSAFVLGTCGRREPRPSSSGRQSVRGSACRGRRNAGSVMRRATWREPCRPSLVAPLHHGPLLPVVVEPGGSLARTASRWRRPKTRTRSRHSRPTMPTNRSTALARGARTELLMPDAFV